MRGKWLLAAAVAVSPALAGAAAAAPFVRVTPSTVQAGEQVEIQASCDANKQEATVVSDAFGRVLVRPDNGVLTVRETVPTRTPPRSYEVALRCGSTTTESARTTLTVVNMSKPTQGPAAGAGGAAGGTVPPLALTAVLGVIAAGAGVVLVVRARRTRPGR
jgi:hypothetical protein